MPRDYAWLFHHNPPTPPIDADLCRSLFVDREGQLGILTKRIVQSRRMSLVRAIHGESRVGKSHLALRFLVDLDEDEWRWFAVNAGDLRTARLVVQRVYREVLNALKSVTEPAPLEPEDVSSEAILREAIELGETLDPLVSDAVSSLEVSLSATREESVSVKILTNVFGLGAQGKHGVTRSTKAALRPPSDYQISRVAGELMEVLRLTTGRRVLLYIDDLDLLELGLSEEQVEFVKLRELLAHLATDYDVTVIASLRTARMTIREKSLENTLQVRDLPEASLRQVHDRHIERFNDGEQLLEPGCLDLLLEDAQGKAGRLLGYCRALLDWAEQEQITEARLLTEEDLRGFVRYKLNALEALGPSYREHLDKIREAVKQGRREVILDPSAADTELIFFILDEPADPARRVYDISPLAAAVIRGLVGSNG